MLTELVEVAQKRKRIITLDILRGFFLFVIIIDHLNRFPNGFDLLTGRGLLWFSAAEGFVAISGVLIGYIYGPRIKSDPKKTVKRLLQRSLKIYLCVLGLSFFFMAYSFGIAAIPNESLEFVQRYGNDISTLLIDSFTLQYVYGWGEFLSHYVFYLILSPLVLYALVKGKAFWVIALSVAVWILSFHPFVPRSRIDFTLSWQILFILGTVIGYYLPKISTWIQKHFTKHQRTKTKRIAITSSVVIYLVSLYFSWGYTYFAQVPFLHTAVITLQNHWDFMFTNSFFGASVDKTTLGPLRILMGTLIFWTLFILVSNYVHKIPNKITDFLKTLGEKSLFVYGLQAVIIFFIGLYVAYPTSIKELPILHTAVAILALYVTYEITKNTSYFRHLFTSYGQKLIKYYRR